MNKDNMPLPIRAFLCVFQTVLWMLAGTSVVHAQLVINQTQPPSTLVQNVLLGANVFSSNITFNGYPGNAYPAGEEGGRIARFNGASSNVGLTGGVVLHTGDVSYLPGPNDQILVAAGGFPFNSTPDLDLSLLSGNPYWQVSGGSNVYNKSILEFDFIPMYDMVKFRYVFSSEEYEKWACSQYNDAFGFFISGPGFSGPYLNGAINLAMIPGTLTPVSINTVNSGMVANNANGPVLDPFSSCFAADPNWMNNTEYYIYNGSWGNQGGGPQNEQPYCCDPYYIQHNGLTVVMEATAAVQCGQQYHIKLAIGNIADWRYPSAVFLEQGSFTSEDRFDLTVREGPNVVFASDDTTFLESDCDSVYLQFHRRGGHYLDEYLQITVGGTSTAGVDYASVLPDSIHFNQFDSTVVVAIAVPVDLDGLEDLVITLVTCDGLKLQTYDFLIDQRPPLVVALEDQQAVCPGTFTLTPTVTGGSEDASLLTYLWSTGATTPSISVEVEQSTQFWVTVRDSCWTVPVTDSAWVYLPLYDPLSLSLTPDTAIPCLATADLLATASGGEGTYSYSWSLNSDVIATTANVEVPAAIVPVYYVAEVTDGCGQVVQDSVLVSQAPPVPLTITLTPDTAIPCLGTADLEVLASGGGGVLSYSWTQGVTVLGTTPVLSVPAGDGVVYAVEVSDECGQVVNGSVLVSTGPTPPLSLVAVGDTVLCANETLVLTVLSVTGGGGAYGYAWTPAGTGSSNEPTLEVSIVDDALYTVTVTDECGNTADTTLSAVVLDHDPLVLTVMNDTIVCPGEEVQLWVTVEGGAGGYQISWQGVGSGSPVTWTAGSSSTVVGVTVTDECGITVEGSVALDVYPASAQIEATQLGDSYWSFTAETDPATGNDLEWDLGDGTIVLDQTTVTHTYTDVEAHWVLLYMVTPEGCMAVDSVLTEPPSATLYFPNTFTPNGDGINDSFGGEGRLVEEYELLIFDRWGRIMFESQDLSVRWDGRMDGEEVMDGVYQYRYKAKGLKMPLHQKFGHVTLLR